MLKNNKLSGYHHLGKGAFMVRVVSTEGGTTVRLCCVVCGHPLSLTTAWLCFPAGSRGDEGQWVHRSCANGEIQRLVGGDHAVLMRGMDALRNMAGWLQEPVAVE
jgi:hypothetical protein